MNAAALMAAAWAIEAAFGWPGWLYRRIGHPVAWFGAWINMLDRTVNTKQGTHRTRYIAGAVSSLITIAAVGALVWVIATLLPRTWWGFAIEAAIASSLIASRSLYTHVSAVAMPLMRDDMGASRQAVTKIVGRDPNALDDAGIARAALESLAENASDGVIAPVFWGALFGLPGIAVYKAINTLDSMIGHRTPRYNAFGGFAARLDDVVNYVPARITGLLIAASSCRFKALQIMVRDAGRHRSPNAGWPEAAMAGALKVRLSGPRRYGDHISKEPWLNGAAPDPSPHDITRGLRIYGRVMMIGYICLCVFAMSVVL